MPSGSRIGRCSERATDESRQGSRREESEKVITRGGPSGSPLLESDNGRKILDAIMVPDRWL